MRRGVGLAGPCKPDLTLQHSEKPARQPLGSLSGDHATPVMAAAGCWGSWGPAHELTLDSLEVNCHQHELLRLTSPPEFRVCEGLLFGRLVGWGF